MTKTAIITGASKGVGKELSMLLYDKGYNLGLVARDFSKYPISEGQSPNGGLIKLFEADLRRADDIQSVCNEIKKTYLNLDVLVEIHDKQELMRALSLDIPLIGINNRNLKTFETDLYTSLNLLADIPPEYFVVSESGIHTSEDVNLLRNAGINIFLVGEAFMKADLGGLVVQVIVEMQFLDDIKWFDFGLFSK